MTEYEALEAIYTIRATTAADGMYFVSILSAYLVVAYVVGPELSRFQVITITILYSLFLTMPINGMYSGLGDLLLLEHPFRPDRPEGAQYVIPGVMIVAWIASVLFMIQVRVSGKVE